MKQNLHTHTTWCDGKNSVEEMTVAAIEKGFDVLGFSSHAMFPIEEPGNLFPAKAQDYVCEVRRVGEKYADRIKVLCAVEADFIPGLTAPEKSRYSHLGLDYLIGSIHYVAPKGGAKTLADCACVDNTPEILVDDIKRVFGGDVKGYICAYFEQERRMALDFDFDIIGHPDLIRKFNGRLAYFDEKSDWYRAELVKTADAFAQSGKTVEINTGAISRGWMDDAYPSSEFISLLRERGVKLVLNSDAHAAPMLDYAFERFAHIC